MKHKRHVELISKLLLDLKITAWQQCDPSLFAYEISVTDFDHSRISHQHTTLGFRTFLIWQFLDFVSCIRWLLLKLSSFCIGNLVGCSFNSFSLPFLDNLITSHKSVAS